MEAETQAEDPIKIIQMFYGMNCPEDLGIKVSNAGSMDEEMKAKEKRKQSCSFDDTNKDIKNDNSRIQHCSLDPKNEMNNCHMIRNSEPVKNGFSEEISEPDNNTVDKTVYVTGEICFPERKEDKTRLWLYEAQRSKDVMDHQVMALEYNITQNNYSVTLHSGGDSSTSEDESFLSGKSTQQSLSTSRSKICSNKQSLDRELEEKPLLCDDWDVGFSEKEDVKIQKRNFTGEKAFTCDECGADFTRRSSLKTHKRIHTGEKPYKCDICGADFARSGALTTHRRIHTGEKPYCCEDCGVAFTHKSTLQLHRKIHTGEKSNKCDVCGADFTFSSALKEHQRVHTGEKPFKCDICGVDFARGSALKTHRRIHTGEKPYKCDVCGIDFARAGTLKIHSRTHTGEKPYCCNICGASFSHSSSLKTHNRVHTGEKVSRRDSERKARKDRKRMHRRKALQL